MGPSKDLQISPPSPKDCCGHYYSKKHYPAQHATDQLTQDIIANKSGKAFASERIAKRMAKDIQAKDWDFGLIIPVPNYKTDSKYNVKAPLLARNLSDNISIPYQNDVLVRIANSSRRYFGVTQRREAAKKDYRISNNILKNNNLIKDRNVLLIDDVSTSGATIEVCRGLLDQYGAKIVYTFCAAETMK